MTLSGLRVAIIRLSAHIPKPSVASCISVAGATPTSEGWHFLNRKLLDELWSYATQEAFVWHSVWQVGDLVLWDNRCTMHRRDAFDAGTRRIMHRTQIKGDTRPRRLW